MVRTIFDDLYSLNREMNRIFHETPYQVNYWAKTNIYENGDEYVIISKLPGIGRDDVSIMIKDNTLKISGERKKESKGKSSELLNERFSGKFERNFMLNEKVDVNNIKAEIKNGLLMIKTAKSPESKPRKIEIK